jgi:NAD(P)-dependent dehydrogenase (short-subunit alcohol dehydrogenase family)
MNMQFGANNIQQRVNSGNSKVNLSGKTVLITGCSRGLGLGLARNFISAGCLVIATCRTPSKAPELGEVIKRGVKGSCVIACDVDSEQSIE